MRSRQRITENLDCDLVLLTHKGRHSGLLIVLGLPLLFLYCQVADEKFLVLINDLLASGEIPDLIADDEAEEIINSLRAEVKGSGIDDSRENCWRFFIDKVRRTLKVYCAVRFFLCLMPLIPWHVTVYVRSSGIQRLPRQISISMRYLVDSEGVTSLHTVSMILKTWKLLLEKCIDYVAAD